MINKVLCFMWGHVFINHYGVACINDLARNILNFRANVKVTKCKFCGARDV